MRSPRLPFTLRRMAGTVLNLAVFTGTAASVPARPDFLALGLPVAGLVGLAAGTLLVQARTARTHITGALRLEQ